MPWNIPTVTLYTINLARNYLLVEKMEELNDKSLVFVLLSLIYAECY